MIHIDLAERREVHPDAETRSYPYFEKDFRPCPATPFRNQLLLFKESLP